MALATAADVKRYIPGYSESADDNLELILAAVEAWVEKITGADWDASGTVIDKFYNARDGDILTLKDESPTNVVVTAYLAHDSTGSVLTVNTQYHVRDNGKIELVRVRFGSPQGLPEATVEVRATEWAKIEVAYTASNSVPAPVREAVAMITAATWIDSRQAGDNLISEKLGDYSYTRASSDTTLAVPKRARIFLNPYNRKLRVRST